MNKYEFWADVFASNKKLIVALVEILGGLITVESYNLLKRPNQTRLRIFIARAVITFFVCLLLNTYIAEFSPKYHFLLLGALAISCVPILEWFLNSLLPATLKVVRTGLIDMLINFLTRAKADDRKGDKPE